MAPRPSAVPTPATTTRPAAAPPPLRRTSLSTRHTAAPTATTQRLAALLDGKASCKRQKTRHGAPRRTTAARRVSASPVPTPSTGILLPAVTLQQARGWKPALISSVVTATASRTQSSRQRKSSVAVAEQQHFAGKPCMAETTRQKPKAAVSVSPRDVVVPVVDVENRVNRPAAGRGQARQPMGRAVPTTATASKRICTALSTTNDGAKPIPHTTATKVATMTRPLPPTLSLTTARRTGRLSSTTRRERFSSGSDEPPILSMPDRAQEVALVLPPPVRTHLDPMQPEATVLPPPRGGTGDPTSRMEPTPQREVAPPCTHEPVRRPSQPALYEPTAGSTRGANLVKLNLRNANGSCRGRKKRDRPHNKWKPREATSARIERPAHVCARTGTDPVDDFVDGHAADRAGDGIPTCQGHGRPCCLRTVRKSTSLHRGRKFYVCAQDRSEQCNHFEWAEEAVAGGYGKNKHGQTHTNNKADTNTAFCQRQVQLYLQNLQGLTLPELRSWAKTRKLDTRGKRAHVWTRVALFVRDAVASSLPPTENGSSDAEDDNGLELVGAPVKDSSSLLSEQTMKDDKEESDEEDNDDDEADDDDEEEEELELVENPVSKDPPCPVRARLRSLFGHDDFRPGQEWTIRRCLEGQRTLLVAPTGLGKSLCYALPAALQPDGVVIVVSPLLSLIQDQLRELPPSLPAASLSGTTPSPTLLQDLRRGRLRILFVSPERLVSPSFRRLFSKTSWNSTSHMYERIMPPVSLLCVDEAHCLSQWGHNFRPCYLRLQSMLDLIQPKSVLAITATAGPRVISDITATLGMSSMSTISTGDDDDTAGIKIFKADRDNIDVTAHFVADHGERLQRLVEILSSRKGKTGTDQAGLLKSGSVIVYVWRQMDAEAIAEYLTAASVPGKVVVYHGGMDGGSRAKSQSLFLRGKARICVATVAFGLGINKADVEGVVHMYLSASPEHYLQEIGRAGRNGSAAHAIALIVPEEVQIRHSLSYSDLLAKSQVMSLFRLLRQEVRDALSKLPGDRPQPDELCVGLSLKSALIGCECKPETAETIFSLLEARQTSLLRVQGTFYGRAIVAPKNFSLEELAAKEHVLGAILQCCQCVEPPAGQSKPPEKRSAGFGGHNLVGQTFGTFCFSIAQCANCLGPDAEPRHVFAALRRLQSSGHIEYVLDTTPAGRCIHMHLKRGAVEAFAIKDNPAYDDLIDETCQGFNLAVTTTAGKVLEIYRILRQVDEVSPKDEGTEYKSASLTLFQEMIRDYLAKDGGETDPIACGALKTEAFAASPSRRSLDLAVWSIVRHLKEMQSARATAEVDSMSLDHASAADYVALAVTKFLQGVAPASTTPSLCRQHSSYASLQSVEFSALRTIVTSVVG